MRAPTRQEAAQESSAACEQWTAVGGPRGEGGAAVRVLQEGDPPPAALLGRLSFNSFNPHTERLAAAREEELQLRKATLRERSETVTAQDMALRLAPTTSSKQGRGAQPPQGKPAKRAKTSSEPSGQSQGFLRPPEGGGSFT